MRLVTGLKHCKETNLPFGCLQWTKKKKKVKNVLIKREIRHELNHCQKKECTENYSKALIRNVTIKETYFHSFCLVKCSWKTFGKKERKQFSFLAVVFLQIRNNAAVPLHTWCRNQDDLCPMCVFSLFLYDVICIIRYMECRCVNACYLSYHCKSHTKM